MENKKIISAFFISSIVVLIINLLANLYGTTSILLYFLNKIISQLFYFWVIIGIAYIIKSNLNKVFYILPITYFIFSFVIYNPFFYLFLGIFGKSTTYIIVDILNYFYPILGIIIFSYLYSRFRNLCKNSNNL